MEGNKLFVKTMIVTAVVALALLILMAVMGMRYFTQDQQGTYEPIEPEVIESQSEESSKSAIGVIENIEEDQMIFFDSNHKKSIEINLENITHVVDKSGQVMPKAQLQVGDIIEVSYAADLAEVTEIKIQPESWIKRDQKNLQIQKEDFKVLIGEKSYSYSEYTTILGADGQLIAIEDLGEYDNLELKGIGDTIHSIKVIEKQGFIQLDGLPTKEGMLELDLNRQIPIHKMTEPIAVSAGVHQVTIKLKGYRPVAHQVEVKAGETAKVSLDGVTLAYGRLNLQILGEVSDYKVKVGDQTFGAKDIIEVLEGQYDVIITAEGFKPWGMKVDIKGQVVLQVKLEEAEKPKEEQSSSDNSVVKPVDFKISIATEPAGAKVLINGQEKGVTPLNTILPIGDYSIALQKEGYEEYSTTIIMDNSDNQHSYLYVLTPNSQEE